MTSAITMFTTCVRLPAESPADVRGGLPLIAKPPVTALPAWAADNAARSAFVLTR